MIMALRDESRTEQQRAQCPSGAPAAVAVAVAVSPRHDPEICGSRTRGEQVSLVCARRAEAAQPRKSKKRLRWSTITVHEFGVGLGGGAVPSKGGPSIGLSDAPEFTWTTRVGEMAECSEGIHRFTSDERIQLLQEAGISDGMILRFSRETNIILTSRKRTAREDAEEKRAKRMRTSVLRIDHSLEHRPRMIPPNFV